jgi:hypothetical protein
MVGVPNTEFRCVAAQAVPRVPGNGTGTIAFNSNIDWSTGTAVACTVSGTSCQTFDLAAGFAEQVGAATMTAQQMLDLTFLHELAHSFGVGHDGAVGTGQMNTAIWDSCFSNLLPPQP